MTASASIWKSLSREKIWIAVNIVGIVLYLYFASRIWAPPGESGLEGGPGDPFIWVISAFPFLAVCFIVNIIWLALMLFKLRKSSAWIGLLLWIFLMAAWLGANRYDVYRQYTGSPVQNDTKP